MQVYMFPNKSSLTDDCSKQFLLVERHESSLPPTSGTCSCAPSAMCGRVCRVPCRAAYRRLILPAHPDKGGSVEAFERVQQAYNRLSAMTQR